MIDDTQVSWIQADELEEGDVVVFDGIARTISTLSVDGPLLRSIPGEPNQVLLSGRVLRVDDTGGVG